MNDRQPATGAARENRSCPCNVAIHFCDDLFSHIFTINQSFITLLVVYILIYYPMLFSVWYIKERYSMFYLLPHSASVYSFFFSFCVFKTETHES